MLFYRWNLSFINIFELQRVILAFGLVNWLDKSTVNKAIDLGLEYLNGSCKTEMKYYKNSTYDVDFIFNRVYLFNTWVRALRAKLEETFEKIISETHTIVFAVLETFSLTRNLIVRDLGALRNIE